MCFFVHFYADDDDPGDEFIRPSEHDEKEWRKDIWRGRDL